MKYNCGNGHTLFMCRECGHVGCQHFYGCANHLGGDGMTGSTRCGRCGSFDITTRAQRIGELEYIRDNPVKIEKPKLNNTPVNVSETMSTIGAMFKALIFFVVITTACFYLGWNVPLSNYDGIKWIGLIIVKILGFFAFIYWHIIIWVIHIFKWL